MNSKLEKVENNQAVLEITVTKEAFAEGIEKAYKKTRNKFNVPGFRKGKVPKNFIEKFYGEGVFYEDAINEVCPDAYDAAVEEHKLDPVDRPEIDIVDISKENGVVFKATVTVKPEVVLGEYKGLKVEMKEIPVTDSDVDGELETLRNKNARIVTITERAVKSGDIATLDFAGFVDGVAFEGGTAKDYKLEIGSGQFIPGFEDQLIGAEIGVETEVNVTFPEEYQAPDLAGKPALFKVTINELKEKQLLAIDDEFAKDVSEFETLEELKADLKKKRTEESEKIAKQTFEDAVIDAAVENAKIEIPAVMVETQVAHMLRDFDQQLRYQGMDLKGYMGYMGHTEETLKESMMGEGEKRVKTQLVLDAIRKAENIVATEEDIEAEIEKTAKMYNQDVEDFKKKVKASDLEKVADGLSVQKTVDFLVANN